jgi:hypothetical protein
MDSQKGFIPILIIAAILLLGVGGAAGAALVGQAKQCPDAGTIARSEKAIGDAIGNGSTTITNGEATTLAQNYIGGKVTDGRICFTDGLGHVSGKIDLGSVSPSFYVSAGVDLSGSTPKATNLSIQLGSLPNIPAISSLAQGKINELIEQNLAKIELKEKYTAQFSNSSVTIKK